MTTSPLTPSPALTSTQKQQYDEWGYFVVPNLFTKNEVEEMLQECSAILAGDYGELYEGAFQKDPGSTAEHSVERKITAVVERSAIFRQHLLKKDLLLRLQDILGPDILLFRDILMLKPALVGSKMPWHQDSNYWPIEPTELCSVWTALDPATIENGCMRVVPRSHKLKLIKARKGDGGGALDDDQISLDQAIDVPMSPGSSLFFHSRLLHGSEANHSPYSRRAFITSFMSARSIQTKKGAGLRSRYFLVSGQTYEGCVS
jgi:phytanoyl-CoA hydroxylase